MNEEIPLKERAICPECKKPFRMKEGTLIKGHLMCHDCAVFVKYRRYTR